MQRKHIVVLGSSFAGLRAALELNRQLGTRHDVTVISKSDQFVFKPLLGRVPFGLETSANLSFSIRPRLENQGIRFRHDEVIRLHLDSRSLLMKEGYEEYDYLLIATGAKPNYAAVPGLGPSGYAYSLTTLSEAERTRSAFEKLLKAPGPVVVGCVQGALHTGAPLEFLFNAAYQLEQHGLASKDLLTYLTFEPALPAFGPFGANPEWTEYLFSKLGVRTITNGAIQHISRDEIWLIDGRKLPYALAVLLPPCLGANVVRACERITDAAGFVRVNDCYQTNAYPEVFAAGAAVAIPTADTRALAPSHSADETGRISAHNIAATVLGEHMVHLPPEGAESPSLSSI